MVKHIVVWGMKPETPAEQKQEMKRRLESLVGKIPNLLQLEVGVDANNDTLSLYSTFPSEADLLAYQEHVDHQAVVRFVKPLILARSVCDYSV